MEKRAAAQRRQWEESMNASPDNKQKEQRLDAGDANGDATLQPAPPVKHKPGNSLKLPERYAIKTNGNEKVLTCLETPNLNVHIEAGLTFSASVAHKSPSGTIFLDGVAQCEPFMDHERQVYNLDHHEGCVRAFTLATCEQALVMYMKGLDLRNREWNIFANEPDLDTLLAIWILLNHTRIGAQDTTQRRLLFALVRYEGVIDALGLELKELSALPAELMRKIQRIIDHLRGNELTIKREGRWGETDYLAYTAAALNKIDQIFYKPSDFIDYQGMEELARIDLTEQRIAVVVGADMGIYEIEPHLNKLYGERLGVVFLKKGPNTYTVRQMDLFMPISLEAIYERLNFSDPAVKCRTQSNKWGGASDIGGSPRESGTHLLPFEIVQACREAVAKPDWRLKSYRFAVTTALTGLIVLCAHVVRLIWAPEVWLSQPDADLFWTMPDFGFMLTLLLAAGVSLAVIARGRSWQYGGAVPIGRHWWLLMPAALAGGLLGGVWAPDALVSNQEWLTIALMGLVAMPFAVELLFRGLAHGLLAQHATIQRCDTRWFLSWPILGSSLLYVGFVLTLLPAYLDETMPSQWPVVVSTLGGAALLGLAAGWVRERSQSLWPAVWFHMCASAAAFLMHALW
jgi:hypothetical protein